MTVPASERPAGAPAEPPAGAGVLPWHLRLIDIASTYLPLLLMAFLALGTWWLVKNTPLFGSSRTAPPAQHVPDYTMSQFTVQRFGRDGAMRAQIEGDVLRHYPDTNTIEIDNPRIRAVGRNGHVMLASAKRALSNADGSELQLLDDAHVVREASAGEPAIDFRSEFLHAYLNTEQVRSHLPVLVTQGETAVTAAGMHYDNLTRVVELTGRMRAVFATPARPVAAPKRP